MHTDPISDFITRIRNAQRAALGTVVSPASRMKVEIAKILEREGYLEGIAEETEGPKRTLKVGLKYHDKEPVIRSIKRISKPGRRVYRKADELPRVLSDIGIAIVSTSSGLMTNKEARKRKLGGEVLCEVY